MKIILILGAGKSATVLIDFLCTQAPINNWQIHIADQKIAAAQSKAGNHPNAFAFELQIENTDALQDLISKADIVISMLPPSFHFTIGKFCLAYRKHLIHASYISEEFQQLDKDVAAAGLSFIGEMGLDPGIDHMSAVEMIDSVKNCGGKITSFISHCGGLIAPESDNNPWHYKISWNPRNVVIAGKDGAQYLENNLVKTIPYSQIFTNPRKVHIFKGGNFEWYPNRDSISYIKKYNLESISTFIRTTLRYPDFCDAWNILVNEGFTIDEPLINLEPLTTKKFFQKLQIFLSKNNLENTVVNKMFDFIGMNENYLIPSDLTTYASILQHIIEVKLALAPEDKDMVVMQHELKYTLEGKELSKNSSLIVKGIDQSHTAMAKTVGLPLAFAAIHLLNGNISRKGVFIPIYEDAYKPILQDLSKHGIVFYNE
jgi:saccharopine dehydrogenase (NADP+, L-glutamate forming)